MNAATEKMTNLEWLTQIGLKAIEYTEDPKGTGERSIMGRSMWRYCFD